MKRKIVAVMTAGMVMLLVAGAASADSGGIPSVNACTSTFGQFVGTRAKGGNTPSQVAADRNTSVQDLQQVGRDLYCP